MVAFITNMAFEINVFFIRDAARVKYVDRHSENSVSILANCILAYIDPQNAYRLNILRTI